MRVTARTRVFAILGDPVSHSLSPRMQNAAFQAAGIDAVYIALRATAESLHGQMASLASGGGGGNVTIPFKEIAARVPGVADAQVSTLGSANVFAGHEGAMALGNTDVHGIAVALDQLDAVAGAWLLLGTGGSARGVAGAAAARGARIAVRSRDAERARTFAAWAESIGVAAADPDECGVIINATPLGLSAADSLPLDPATIRPDVCALDLVYRLDGPTAWVRECAARGIRAIDGREVLLAQGAESWRLWFPGIAPPIEVMRAALDGRLV